MGKPLYLVGQVIGKHTSNNWIFQGIYSTENKAIKKCINETFFLAEIHLDFDEPSALTPYDYAYYPITDEKPIRY